MSAPRLRGWHLAGTDRWWPAMFGEPPFFDRWDWRPLYVLASGQPGGGSADE